MFFFSIAAILSLLIVVGILLPGRDDRPSEAERDQRERCSPVVWRPGMDQSAWDQLISVGYELSTFHGKAAIYPPGCDSFQQD